MRDAYFSAYFGSFGGWGIAWLPPRIFLATSR